MTSPLHSPERMKPAARFVLVVGSTAVYFGLAVLGWRGFRAFLSHPALFALTLTTALLVILSYGAGGNLSPGVQEDKGNRWVIFAFSFAGLLGGYLPAYTDRVGFGTIDGETIRWIGVALFAVGGVLRVWPVYVLGHRFSGLVAIQPGHTLVKNGLYRYIRHPSYLGLLVNSLGWDLAFRSTVGVVLTALLIPLLVVRIRSEETLLRAYFGGEYDSYCQETSRLIPGVY